MTAGITLADAITALVAEKRAVGYKYDAEERVLARFEAFCRSEFPGLDTLTQASVEAWIAAARRRGVKPATLQGLAAPVRELARWLGRRGVAGLRPARGRAAQARPLRPAHLHRPGTGGPVRPDRPLPLLLRRSRSGTWSCRCCSARSTPAACAAPRPGCCASATSTSTPGCCRSATPRAARTGRCPSPSRCATGSPTTTPTLAGQPALGLVLPRHGRAPLTLGNVDKNFRRFLWQARISHGGRGHGPRVHDLRHTFAVNNLRSWFAAGEDVGALLPVLQTYMGHSSIADTAYYLRLTAESYPDITARVQQAIGDVVPPVTAGPRHGD